MTKQRKLTKAKSLKFETIPSLFYSFHATIDISKYAICDWYPPTIECYTY